jgi:hypothetical protein
MFNWKNCKKYTYPFKYILCDNFLTDFSDELFPDQEWTSTHLLQRENMYTKGISAIQSINMVQDKTKNLLNGLLSQEFHNKVCEILEIPLIDEKVSIRKTPGDYRIAREAMFVENYYTSKNILEVHYDSEVTIWTGLLYFSDSKYGAFNIHDKNKTIVEKIPIKKNRLIITENSNKTWHSVDPWLESKPRKSIYTTAEFKNFGRDKDRKPIGATETWIKED